MQREYHPDKASKHDPNGTVQMPEEVDQSDRKTGNGGVDEHGARTDNRRKTISYKSLKTLESHGNEILRRIICNTRCSHTDVFCKREPKSQGHQRPRNGEEDQPTKRVNLNRVVNLTQFHLRRIHPSTVCNAKKILQSLC